MKKYLALFPLVLCILLTIVPCVFLVTFPATVGVKSLSMYTSALLGYIGIVLLLWMFVIGIRPAAKYWSEDISLVNRVHRWLGTYGMLFVFAHPIFTVFGYSESIFYSIVPHISSEFERHVTLGRVAIYILAFVWLTSAIVRKSMKYRPWKYIHYLSYLVVPFALLHIPDIGTQYQAHAPVRVFVIVAWTTFALIAGLRVALWCGVAQRTYRVHALSSIADGAFMLTLAPQSAPLMVRTGQYVTLRLGVLSEEHPFSVAYVSEKSGELTLVFRAVGMFTKLASTLHLDKTVYLSGGYGAFLDTFRTQLKPIVVIAGGVGIVPFLQYIFDTSLSMQLLYVNRTTESTAFAEEIIKARGDQAKLLYTQQPNTHTFNGRFTQETIQQLISCTSDNVYYICGPQAMMDSVTDILLALGVASQDIHTESFSI